MTIPECLLDKALFILILGLMEAHRFSNHPNIILANVMFTDQSSAKAKHILY